MASPSKIQLRVEDTGIVQFKPQDAETAARTSELLQENHDKHHVFFNTEGFHNHITHGLLTLYGLGAPLSAIEKHFKNNASYQLPSAKLEEKIVKDMSNPELFKKYLGKGQYYHDFLVFFQNEIEAKGWENVLNEYLFSETELADNLLGRVYAGYLHPFIHLGFGLEFKQPAIIAEGLAQACVHDTWAGDYLFKAEKAAKSNPSVPSKTLPQLLDEIRSDQKLVESAHWEDANKVRDGVLKRAPDEMIKHAIQWQVTESNLEEKTAEMISSAIYFTAAAQNPPKQVKFDFFYMHSTNSSIFSPTFNALPSITTRTKIRLLQWKGYLDLAMYVSRGSPPLPLEEIAMYTPKRLEAGDAEWKGVFTRLFNFEDDGHAIKLARAVRNGELICGQYEDQEWARIKGFMWEKIGNMVVDSVEDTGETWVRSVGFEEAWKDYEDRPRQVHL